MVIYNKTKSVYIEIAEHLIYAGSEYKIYKIDQNNCLGKIPLLTGFVPEDLKFEIVLPDGNYKIVVAEDNSGLVPTITETFLVIYNYLPEIVKQIKDVLCPNCNCTDCEDQESKKDRELKVLHTYFNINNYFLCFNIFEVIPYTKNLSCKFNNQFNAELNNSKNYGKFKFKYIKKLEEFFIYLYTELEKNHNQSIKSSDQDNLDIISLFNKDIILNCILELGYDYNELIRNINNFKCNCDE